MKVVIAMDSFKGSLTSMEAGQAVKHGILRAIPEAQVAVNPLADGGEGTAAALIEGLGALRINLRVTGPMGKPVSAFYGLLPESGTAIMDMASAAGLTLVNADKRDPLSATTYGVGEMILDAAKHGCRSFIIGIGGSATNDGGLGMLKALGYRFLDKNHRDVAQGAQGLAAVAYIITEHVHPLIADCHFQIACDVTNPLCGANGATYIYGPQKGVMPTQQEPIDRAMRHYACICAHTIGRNHMETAGAGAAGGLGFAFLTFLDATLIPGIDLVLKTLKIEQQIADADFVVTGEGRLDHQTAMGKAPVGIARLAQNYPAKVIAFAGSVTSEAADCNRVGIDAFFPIVRGVTTLDEAMKKETALANMAASAEQVFRLIR